MRNSEAWQGRFTTIGSATGTKQVRELETRYIEQACEEYIRDQHQPFPLNEKVEIGSSTLLVAAKTIHKERKELEEEKSHTHSLQLNLESAEQERDKFRKERISVGQSLDRARKERDKFQKERDALKGERDQLRQERDNLLQTRASLRSERNSARQGWEHSRRERDRARTGWDNARNTLASLSQKHVQLEARWNREKDSIRAGKFVTALYKVGRLAVVAIVLLVLVGLFDPQIRTSYGRFGPALSLLINGTPQVAVAPAVATRTPRPTSTSPATTTPRPGATPTTTHYVSATGAVNARACPRRDCSVLRTLVSGSGVTVVEEVRGERVNAASERWALVVLPDLSRRAYVYSAFLGPDPASPHEASATLLSSPTLRSTATSTATLTPQPTATLRRTATQRSIPSPTPRLLNALFDGVRARACPRRDCDILGRLSVGGQATILGETQGEQVEGSTLWYRIALPNGTGGAFVHSSLLGPPTLVPSDG